MHGPGSESRLQKKKVVRIITGSKNKDSSCCLFRKLNIPTLQSQYIFSLLCFVIMNRDQYKLNSNIHGRNTRHSSNFHQTIVNFTLYQGVT